MNQPAEAELYIGPDGLARTPWAGSSPQMCHYYDTEWGMPITDERGLFERICLEGFQAGLSWATILRKREAFRQAFDNFQPDVVATFDDARVEELANNPEIIRHRGKIKAAIKNAQATLRLREEGGLAEFVWSFKPDNTPEPRSMNEVPTQSPESIALSKALKKRGFSFVGPTTTYALMEAIGMVDTHLIGSYRRGCSGIWAS